MMCARWCTRSSLSSAERPNNTGTQVCTTDSQPLRSQPVLCQVGKPATVLAGCFNDLQVPKLATGVRLEQISISAGSVNRLTHKI